jgi:hypothetical protein
MIIFVRIIIICANEAKMQCVGKRQVNGLEGKRLQVKRQPKMTENIKSCRMKKKKKKEKTSKK